MVRWLIRSFSMSELNDEHHGIVINEFTRKYRVVEIRSFAKTLKVDLTNRRNVTDFENVSESNNRDWLQI